MADFKQKLGTAGQALTLTLASLASAASRECTVVDNTTDLFVDVKVQIKLKTAAASVVATGRVDVFAYATADGGTTYSGGVTGADAAYSGNLDNLIFLGSIAATSNATTYSALFNLAKAFGYGGIPAKWGIVVQNNTGAALDATGPHAAFYQGIYAQVN